MDGNGLLLTPPDRWVYHFTRRTVSETLKKWLQD
jgi:hypothetical protein